MRALALLSLIACLGLTPAPLLAQEESAPASTSDPAPEDDKSYLEELIQDSLSGAGREVRVTGFRGALSSNATLQELTISDEEGVWLTLRSASLLWSRSALLSGRLSVQELTAEELIIARPPISEGGVTTQDAEATDFALPDLPVSVEIGQVRIDKITLEKPVIGEPAQLSASGSLSLTEGEGTAELEIRRLDRNDKFDFAASFQQESRVLALELAIDEAEGGLVSKLLKIPGQPEIQLSVNGEAPISDYEARVTLATDGTPRVSGAIGIAALDPDAEGAAADHQFTALLQGDMRPLFAPEFHAFFGETAKLDIAGIKHADKRLTLDRLMIDAAAVQLDGNLRLDADGWPQSFALTGRLGNAGDTPEAVRLPGSGPVTTLQRATLTADFDAASSENWRAAVTLKGLDRPDLSLADAEITGTGKITRDGSLEQVTADLALALSGLALSDPALAQAAGDSLSGTAALTWQPKLPVTVTDFDLRAGDVAVTGYGSIDGLASGYPVAGHARLIAPDFSRFAALADRPLTGRLEADLAASAKLLGGVFDIALVANTDGLGIGDSRADPLIAPPSRVLVDMYRTQHGTVLDQLRIENEVLSARAEGALDAEAGEIAVTARLEELSLTEPSLSGPASFTGDLAWKADRPLRFENMTLEAAGARVAGAGTLDLQDKALPLNAKLDATVEDLSRFATLAKRPLAGQARARLDGRVELAGADTLGTSRDIPGLADLPLGTFDLTLNTTTAGLAIGEPRLDAALAPVTQLYISARRDTDVLSLRDLSLDSDAIKANGTGLISSESAQITLSAHAAELSQFDPKLSGEGTLASAVTWEKGGALRILALEAEGSGAKIAAEGEAFLSEPGRPFEGALSLDAADLSRFAGLVGRPIAGQVTLDAEGSGKLDASAISASIDMEGRAVRTGMAELDRLVAGDISLTGAGSYAKGQAPDLQYLRLDTARLDANASGNGPGQPISLSVRLSDLGLLAPGFNGPATARGTIAVLDETGQRMRLDIAAQGPNNINATITGDVINHGERLDIRATGSAPLALANSFIAPRSLAGMVAFDLRVAGPPALNSVSGEARLQQARLALPTLGRAVENIGGVVRLSGGQATPDISGTLGTGGNFRIGGPITLRAPYPAALQIDLAGLGVQDPDLFATTVNGRITIDGPLTGGARIGGQINLGETELRVPSSGGLSFADLPPINHVGAPAAVHTTLRRAGLNDDGTSSGSGASGAAYPLDLLINAPNRIFVRGRGLDAELGGRLRLRGTTADVIPSGYFELLRGRLDILTKRLDLTEGRVSLQGSFDPYLRFVAETEAEDDVTVRIRVEGEASDPEITFTSDPDLPQDEVIARLIFGRGIDSISAFQAAQLASAVATLAGRGGGGVVGKLRESLGFANLDVTTNSEGETEVTAGTYISDKVYSEVSAASDGTQEINLNYDVSKTITLRGSAGTDGDTGIGIFFEKDY